MENVTRREAFAGIGGGSLATALTVLADKILHRDMVPFEAVEAANNRAFELADQLRVEHSKDIEAQRDRYLNELAECREGR